MATPTKPIAELDVVRLQVAHPEASLPVGATGAVVFVLAQGEAYEVEFIQLDGHTRAVLTLPAAEVAAVAQPWRQAAS